VDRHGVHRRFGNASTAGWRVAIAEEVRSAAILADGSSVELETYTCFLDWFGKTYATQIVASDGEYPLLGTVLLDGHRLEVDYKARTIELT
jgi:predicted aspartyl protease